MDLSDYAGFVAAVMVLGLIPGPNMALVVANSIAYGTRAGVLTTCATISSLLVQLLLVMAGLAALLAAAGAWLGMIRWLGVAYLIGLGVMQWRAGIPQLDQVQAVPVKRIVVQAAAVALGNPKTLLFDAALFTQFISPSRPAVPQIALLAATMAVVLFAMDCGWAACAGRARNVLLRYGRLSNRVSGGLLMGAGVGLAVARVK